MENLPDYSILIASKNNDTYSKKNDELNFQYQNQNLTSELDVNSEKKIKQ